MNEEQMKELIDQEFTQLSTNIANYLFKNNIISNTIVIFERESGHRINVHIKVSNKNDNEINNFVTFRFDKIHGYYSPYIENADNNRRPAIFLSRYFLDNILEFVIKADNIMISNGIINCLKIEKYYSFNNKIKTKTFDI